MLAWTGIAKLQQANLLRIKLKIIARSVLDKSIHTLATVSIANTIINKRNKPEINLCCRHLKRRCVKSANFSSTLTPNTALDVNPSVIYARLRKSTRKMRYVRHARTSLRERKNERVFRWIRSSNICNRVGGSLVTLNPEMQEEPSITSQLRSRESVQLVEEIARLSHWILVTRRVKCAINATAWSILLISCSQNRALILDRFR